MLSELEFVVANLRDLQSGKHKHAEANLSQALQTDPAITKVLLTNILSSEYECML